MRAVFASVAATALAAVLAAPGPASAETPAPGSHGSCLQVLKDVDAGTVPVSKDFMPAACTAEKESAPFHYDSSRRTVIAAHSLKAGAIVSTYAGFNREAIYPGETLKLVASEGAVRIEREVKALQPAHAGQSLFVQGEDGTVWPARYEDLSR